MSRVNFKNTPKHATKVKVEFYSRKRSYRQIEPNVSWSCPKDNKDFVDPHYRCRDCDFFVRLHEDVFGLTVIGCEYPEMVKLEGSP